ncbi:prolyl oligopeptidase family serine peptidase [Flavobacterium sp. FPG59]|jgi:dipeptidyl aminopeptidase/acylaminoacyl peptidase|uniref:S9 family peptidase n=1 Tax=Flavobacterium sp. FPG59 TaxID=1929267 RepID=UPI000A3BE428|nr:prolyl oligopeptidase family serine peptidase [Flavobacterium sp. FPG59]OUD35189.1 peptidase S9 [Flavobacterium sp. FPG59]
MNKNVILIIYIFFSVSLYSQNLKLEEIMKGNAFIGSQPENERWSIDGQKVYFDWNPNNELGNSTYFWKKGMTKPELAPASEALFSRLDLRKSSNPDVYFYLDKGRLYSYSLKNKVSKKLFQHSSPISNLQVSATAGLLFFRQNDNIFQYNINEGSLIQLTNFRKGKADEVASQKETFLKTQQEELFQFVRDQEALKKWNAEKAKLSMSDFPKPYFYGKNTFGGLKMDPKGNYATFRLLDEVEGKREKMEAFITASGYNDIVDTKEKVSVNNLIPSKFGVYNVAKDSVYFINFSTLSHIQDVPKYFELYEKNKNVEKKNKLIIVQEPIYNDDGSYAVSEIRSQDNKDRWIVRLNLEKNTFEEIDYQHDEAWIGGPGIPSSSFGRGTLGFLADNETVYFQSEETGYSHLYTYNLKSKLKTQLTQGNWEVRSVALSKDKKAFYLTTTTTHPGNRSFYKLDISTKKMQPILTNDGAHEVSISPDESSLLVRYSYKNKPWELYVASNKTNTSLKQITASLTESFKAYSWREPEVITFKAQDGTTVHARLYKPQQANANKAAILFVHGAGYLQNAHNYWSSYHREYMFHNMLVDQGYTVLDIDYRGSDGYGRDFRTGIYRFMGGKDLSDHLDGKKYLVENHGIDASKVGIYGGSYGGFITLMGMLTAPKEFASGAALRSVTDWAHYNHGYTGNILNFPETDPDAYKKSSPIYFADNLHGDLLMLHGMVDDNVEYKDIVRLSQRFIELGKKKWSLASFPVEAHGFKETYSWVDEYSRILDLFNQTLLKK